MAIKLNIYLCLKQMNAIILKTDMSPFTLYTLTHNRFAIRHKLLAKFIEEKIALAKKETKRERARNRTFRARTATIFPKETHISVRLLCGVNNHIESYSILFLWRKHSHTHASNVHTDSSHRTLAARIFLFQDSIVCLVHFKRRENACEPLTLSLFFFLRCPYFPFFIFMLLEDDFHLIDSQLTTLCRFIGILSVFPFTKVKEKKCERN